MTKQRQEQLIYAALTTLNEPIPDAFWSMETPNTIVHYIDLAHQISWNAVIDFSEDITTTEFYLKTKNKLYVAYKELKKLCEKRMKELE